MSRSETDGATSIAEAAWSDRPSEFRTYERTVWIGHGDEHWRLATTAVLDWGVKTRSGFTVRPVRGVDVRVAKDSSYTLVATVGPFQIHEPVRVVSVVDVSDRCGFAYATKPGHPVTGEEAFIVHRATDGTVWFTLRSLTRPGRGVWRLAFPLTLLAQRWYRRRYLHALRSVLGE